MIQLKKEWKLSFEMPWTLRSVKVSIFKYEILELVERISKLITSVARTNLRLAVCFSQHKIISYKLFYHFNSVACHHRQITAVMMSRKMPKRHYCTAVTMKLSFYSDYRCPASLPGYYRGAKAMLYKCRLWLSVRMLWLTWEAAMCERSYTWPPISQVQRRWSRAGGQKPRVLENKAKQRMGLFLLFALYICWTDEMACCKNSPILTLLYCYSGWQRVHYVM